MIKSIFRTSFLILCMIVVSNNIVYGASAYWEFENNYTDSSGNNHTLTPAGNLSFSTDTPTQSAGTSSLSFVPQAYATATGYTAPLNNFTFETFFKSGGSATTQVIATTLYHHSPVGGWLVVLRDTGQLSFMFRNDDFRPELTTTNSYHDNQWHHLAFTLSSTYEVNAYVDGISQGTFTGTNSNTRLSLRFGGDNLAGNNPFYGLIDDARVSDGILDPSEFLFSSIPEPSTLILIGCAVTVLTRRIKRNK